MIVLIVVVLILWSGAYSNNADKNFKYCIWVLFAVTAFRHPALGGADTFQYYEIFQEVPSLSGLMNYESDFRIGYIIINVLPKMIFDSYIFFQIFYIAICSYILYKTIEILDLDGKEKCLFLFGFFCYDFMWYFWGTLRQNVADLLYFYLLIYYYKNSGSFSKVKKYLILGLCIFIPNLFHSSAAINVFILPLLFLIPRRANPHSRMIFVTLGSIVIFLTSSRYISMLSSYAAFLDDKYSIYVEDAGVASNVINMVFKLGVFNLFCLNYADIEYRHKKFILDVCSIFVLISSINFGIAGRAAEYYAFGFYVAMAYISRYRKPGRFVLPLFFVAMLVIFIRKTIVTDSGLNSHYYLFFQDPVDIPSMFRAFWRNLPIY